jgi:hypothetical protein
VSAILATTKKAYTYETAVKDSDYNQPITIKLQDYIWQAQNSYRNWSELLFTPSFTGINEIWITYEDDVLPMEFTKDYFATKPMPDKNKLIINSSELQNYYDANLAEDFKEIETEFMKRRETNKQKWEDYLVNTKKFEGAYSKIESQF